MNYKRFKKISPLVINAIRNLQNVDGSTSKEIGNYIANEYNVSAIDIRRQVQLALRRAFFFGILNRKNGGYLLANSNYGNNPLDYAGYRAKETGEVLLCNAPRRLSCQSKKSHSRKGRGCACKKRGGSKRRGRHEGGRRKCGHRKKSMSRRKSRSRRSRSRKSRSRRSKSRRSCGGRRRSRSRGRKGRSKSRSRRSCPRSKRPRRCSDLNLAAKEGHINNNARPNSASLSGSRPNSPGGSTISRSSNEKIEERGQDSRTVRMPKEALD